MNIYVASSWKNLYQPGMVVALRKCGHTVYDFRNPVKGNTGFRWTDIDPDYKGGEIEALQYRMLLRSDVARVGYHYDMAALLECDTVVLVRPCGMSASWEFGYAMGQGKKAYVIQFQREMPELMFREATIIGDMTEFFEAFGEPK